ncbi:hypothetical protein ANN_27178 [Periplaneta americana]|uniref:Reverse transcriptase domain-containing protein n=1 Tax=Periplaneta americana TaxID=6978 RepID=A0ABQ8RXI4_PERAM|nr:hypothetical protein ANN_27178 [Periplaneta americana]
MLRFRLYPFVIICDITQAFLQLVLHPKDSNLTRFLWYKINITEDGSYVMMKIRKTYRFQRLPFRLTNSPFLLSASIRELAIKYMSNFPTAAPLIDASMFMDDFVAGTQDENSIIRLYYELTVLMKQIYLPLSKWATNAKQLQHIWKAKDQEIKTETQIFGIDWNTANQDFRLI